MYTKNVVWNELRSMLDMGLTERSHTDWSSLVPKSDRLVWFYVDSGKVNNVLIVMFDAN